MHQTYGECLLGIECTLCSNRHCLCWCHTFSCAAWTRNICHTLLLLTLL